MQRISITLLLVITLVLGAGIFSQGSEARKSTAMSDLEAVNVVREANTMEYSYKHREKKFATLDELSSMSIKLKNLREQNPSGYTLSVVTPPEGVHYLLSLKASDVNRKSFFSDDAGLIYEGSPIR